MVEQISTKIKIEVSPSYERDQSDPCRSLWYFSYHVRITNETDQAIKLLSRRWVIIDALGKVEQVEGIGVVGLQPLIHPGQSFEYSSFCPLATPTGSMRGHYVMADEKGREMTIEIPTFILAEPTCYH